MLKEGRQELANLSFLELSIKESTLPAKLPQNIVMRPRTREKLHQAVHQYYEFLSERFPEYIAWDGDTFEYTNFEEISLVLNYNTSTGKLGITDVMFPRDKRKDLWDLLESVSEENSLDIAMPIPDLHVHIPFLDVRSYYSIGFASNEGL